MGGGNDMLTWWQVYLWTRLDGILGICIVGATIFLVSLFLYVSISGEFGWKKMKIYFIAQLIIGLVFLFLAIAIPTSGDFALIYVLPKITNNKKLQQIPDKLLDLANQKLEVMLDDIKKGK